MRNNQVKIADFGFARDFDWCAPALETKCGTAHYLAPEIMSEPHYSEKCDIWSCGVILYFFLCGSLPFDAEFDDLILEIAATGELEFAEPEWAQVSPQARVLVTALIELDPAKRMTADQVTSYPWLSGGPGQSTRLSVKDSSMLCRRAARFKQGSRFMKAALQVIARCLPENKITAMRQVFEKLDTLNNGVITPEELRAGMTDLGVDDKCVAEVLASVDVGQTGWLDYTEFLAAMMTDTMLTNDACWEAFRCFDQSGTRQISLEDLQNVMAAGEQLDHDAALANYSEALEVFEEADTNGDNVIDFNEFVTYLQRSLSSSATPVSKSSFSPQVSP